MTAKVNLDEITRSEKTVFSGKVFDVAVKEVELPDKRLSRREVIHHKGGAAIVALDEDRSVYLIKQFRTSFEKVLTEIPAGKLEPNEDPLTCAQRELTEETGLTANHWRLLHKVYPSPGYLDEILYVFLATDLTAGEATPDEGEFVKCERCKIEDVYQAILADDIHDAKTLIGITTTMALIRDGKV